MVTFDTKLALEQFKKRREKNGSVEQVNNSSLPAGSPMYYYCKSCGDHTQTLPENHWGRPKTTCDACQILIDHGLITALGRLI